MYVGPSKLEYFLYFISEVLTSKTFESIVEPSFLTMTSCAKPFEHTNEKSINNIIHRKSVLKALAYLLKIGLIPNL